MNRTAWIATTLVALFFAAPAAADKLDDLGLDRTGRPIETATANRANPIMVLQEGRLVAVDRPEIAEVRSIEARTRRIKKLVVLACVLFVIAAGIVAFHLYVMNLEVFWARATRFLAKRFTF